MGLFLRSRFVCLTWIIRWTLSFLGNEVCQRKSPPSSATLCQNPQSNRNNYAYLTCQSFFLVSILFQLYMPASVPDPNPVDIGIAWRYLIQGMELSGFIYMQGGDTRSDTSFKYMGGIKYVSCYLDNVHKYLPVSPPTKMVHRTLLLHSPKYFPIFPCSVCGRMYLVGIGFDS